MALHRAYYIPKTCQRGWPPPRGTQPWRHFKRDLPDVLCYRTLDRMIVRSVRHRGLRRLIEDDNPRFLGHDVVDRVRNILTALILAERMDSFVAGAPPGWRVHRLSGDRRNEWSVSVSGNWRITFEEEGGYVARLNLEDYH